LTTSGARLVQTKSGNCSVRLFTTHRKRKLQREQLKKGQTHGGKITLVDVLKYKIAHILGTNISCGPVIVLGNVAQPLA
jgi:hypothetical protein